MLLGGRTLVPIIVLLTATACGGSAAGGGSSGAQGGQTAAAAQLQSYLDENFGPSSPVGETSWYSSIQDIYILYDTANVKTSLPQGASAAQSICTAVILSGIEGFYDAKITDAQGDTIASCP